MTKFNGKAIYNPSGKAAEYSKWACNFFVGCSNGCEYCYCKKGLLGAVMGQDKPQLKKCFKNERDAFDIFAQEVKQNYYELKKHGLFFSFTTDPMLPETHDLTERAMNLCLQFKIPVKILTKCTDWIRHFNFELFEGWKSLIAFGFTLTGHDELELNAPRNTERIIVMQLLHAQGFKTFASIEPIIDFESSYSMIYACRHSCDLFKIGLLASGKYRQKDLIYFMYRVHMLIPDSHIYWKDSIVKQAGIERSKLPECCVSRDYNLFN